MVSAYINNDDIKAANFPDLSGIDEYGLWRGFDQCVNLTSFSMPKLIDISSRGMCYAFRVFRNCFSLSTASFPMLSSIGRDGMSYAFWNRINLTEASFPMLAKMSDGGISHAFYNCSSLTEVSFPMLNSIGVRGMWQSFQNCSSLSSLEFQELTNIQTTTFQNVLISLTNISVHFRADMEATFSTNTYIQNGMGGTNTTIIYDL